MPKERVLGCKHCGQTGHFQFACRMKPRKPLVAKKPLKKRGKQASKWLATKEKWLEQNKAPYYFCWICNRMLTRSQLTLDHVKSRSRHPELRYSLKNLKPCCWDCNIEKGSREYDPETRRYS